MVVPPIPSVRFALQAVHMSEPAAPPSGPDARASAAIGGAGSADVLSDVLRSVCLTAAVFFDWEMRSPWVAEAPPAHEIAGTVMPGAQRVIEYHLVARGSCWGNVVGQPPIRL